MFSLEEALEILSFYTIKLNKLVTKLSKCLIFYEREMDTGLFTVFLTVLFKWILSITKKEKST